MKKIQIDTIYNNEILHTETYVKKKRKDWKRIRERQLHLLFQKAFGTILFTACLYCIFGIGEQVATTAIFATVGGYFMVTGRDIIAILYKIGGELV